jgi:hypothetical protein
MCGCAVDEVLDEESKPIAFLCSRDEGEGRRNERNAPTADFFASSWMHFVEPIYEGEWEGTNYCL